MARTPEGKVKDQIRTYMKKTGWTLIHIPGNMFSCPGVPDYLALRQGVCVFIEVKAKTALTEDQLKMKDVITDQGFLHITARSVGDVHYALTKANIIQEQ